MRGADEWRAAPPLADFREVVANRSDVADLAHGHGLACVVHDAHAHTGQRKAHGAGAALGLRNKAKT